MKKASFQAKIWQSYEKKNIGESYLRQRWDQPRQGCDQCKSLYIGRFSIFLGAWPNPSREMLVISRQNGLCLLSGYRQKIDDHALIGRSEDLTLTLSTDRLRRSELESNSKISEVEFLLVDFSPLFFVGSCIVRTFCIC